LVCDDFILQKHINFKGGIKMGNWCDVFIGTQIAEIKKVVVSPRHGVGAGGKAIVAVSGGVDSAVTAMLAWRALDPELLRVFTIDDGLRRVGEPEWVVKTFKKIGIPVNIVRARDEFFDTLAGIEEGNERRSAYSDEFGKICGDVALDSGASYALFGTNALDGIETRQGDQKQHNAWKDMGIDTEEKYGFKVIEPLKTLYKDQIRELARTLNLPREISERMPFPGPGLAIRMLDSVIPERVELVRKVTKIVEDNLLPLKPFQCLACLMKGVVTGKREGKGFFGKVISIRCVDSKDSGQTAIPTLIPMEIQQRIVNRILNSLPEVARVVFDLTPKPPGRIEYL